MPVRKDVKALLAKEGITLKEMSEMLSENDFIWNACRYFVFDNPKGSVKVFRQLKS